MGRLENIDSVNCYALHYQSFLTVFDVGCGEIFRQLVLQAAWAKLLDRASRAWLRLPLGQPRAEVVAVGVVVPDEIEP